MEPLNAIAAASHLDPYPYYRRLLAGPALVFDAALGLWIASRAAVIDEVMADPHCLVRPPGEEVPKAIAGSSAGTVFARLVRMNEGDAHALPKRVIGQALAAVELDSLASRTAQLATMHDLADGEAITRWMFDLPTYVIADMLGFGEAELPQVALWMADFVRCLSPLSTPEQLTSASTAAHALKEHVGRLVQAGTPDSFVGAVSAGWPDQDAVIANLIGLLSQTHEATAGLIGNCIVALLRDPALQEPQRAQALVHEVARHDPPVQNTRRFVARPTNVAGVALAPGDVILLLLAAAGHDEQSHSQTAAFGHGRHACPGQAIALTIAASAINHLLAAPLPAMSWTYAPSANARLPRFTTERNSS